jgi:O-antigen/teichoic acid export membrane protein
MPSPKAGSNSLIGNSFFIFISRFFPSLATLLVVIWYSKRLPEATYGHYQQFWIHGYVLYPVACLGIHVLLTTYSKDFVATIARRLSAAQYGLYVAWVTLLSLLFATLQYRFNGVGFLMPFVFFFAFAASFILEACLVVYRRFGVLVSTNVLYAVAYCVIHWYVWVNGFTLKNVFTGVMVITLVRFVIYLVVATRLLRNTEDTGLQVAMPAVRNLWFHLGVYDVLQILFSWIDKFAVSLVLTAQMSAVYFNGAQNIPFLPLLLTAAGSAVLMQLATNKEGSAGDTVTLMNQSGRLLSCVVFPLFFFLLVFRTELIDALLSARYSAAIPIFAVSVLALPVRAYSFTTVLQRHHRGDIINMGAAADLVLACALMYPLYLWLGLPGVALSFVITTYLQALYYLYHSARILNVSMIGMVPLTNWLVKFILFAAVLITIHYTAAWYNAPKFSLFLGSLGMLLLVAVSLSLEIRTQKRHGRTQSSATA